jgi:hypothetical protein
MLRLKCQANDYGSNEISVMKRKRQLIGYELTECFQASSQTLGPKHALYEVPQGTHNVMAGPYLSQHYIVYGQMAS